MRFNQIYNLDCVRGMRELPENCIDVAICSPPYKTEDNYSDGLMKSAFSEIFAILKDNSLFFLNFGHLKEDKFRPFYVCEIALRSGFELKDTIVWRKNHFTPLSGKKTLNNLSEFIFLLYKGEMPDLDRLSIGVPYKDASNAKRFAGGRNLRCRGNVWDINIPTITKSCQRAHKDEFPVELPELCIKLANIPDDGVVLDCFAGGGSSLVAAQNLNKQFIGFETNPEHFETAEKRLKL